MRFRQLFLAVLWPWQPKEIGLPFLLLLLLLWSYRCSVIVVLAAEREDLNELECLRVEASRSGDDTEVWQRHGHDTSFTKRPFCLG